ARASSDYMRFSLLQAGRRAISQLVCSKHEWLLDNLERLGHPVTLGLGYLAELLKKKKNAASGVGGSGSKGK
nr:hypothetical protein [Tanacetum cinerariifolium]